MHMVYTTNHRFMDMATPGNIFDRLPDALLLTIFNKVADIKALGRCCAVSKRFNSLAPQVGNVVVKVDCVISGEENNLNAKGKNILSQLVKILYGSIVKPFYALQHLLGPKKSKHSEVSHHSPGEVLKNFKEIQHLRIELPGGELGIEEGLLLKWKAEFGSTLESCVILGGSSLRNKKISKCDAGKGWFVYQGQQESVQIAEEGEMPAAPAAVDDSGSIPESFYTDGSLKLRVVWIISSLIAASARHYLLQQIISDHPTLQSLVLTDSDGQGTLCMGKNQLKEFREKPLAASASSNRTQVPALSMKLWYAPHLELPGGTDLEGATLVAIRPSELPPKKDMDHFVATAFEEPHKSAAAVLVQRRTYLLEMNSF